MKFLFICLKRIYFFNKDSFKNNYTYYTKPINYATSQ